MINHNEVELEMRDCYGTGLKPITLSWSRLSDWMKCKQRVKLYYTGGRSKVTNSRSFVHGTVADLVMRKSLDAAPRDDKGRILSLSKDYMLDLLPSVWDSCMKPEDGRILKWDDKNPLEDQKKILRKTKKCVTNLHPILESLVVGHRTIPEFRPSTMPAFGIVTPEGKVGYIRLFLAIDLAVQRVEDDPGIGEWSIWDLKATDNPDYVNKTLWQLVFYDVAFQALTGKHATQHGLITPLLKTPKQEIHITQEHRDTMSNWIVSYCHSVWRGDDALTSDPSNCFNCPTAKACPKNIQVHPLTRDQQGIKWDQISLSSLPSKD